MNRKNRYDAVVVGAGPNGLAAAIRLASEGYSVKVFEAGSTAGGGMRSADFSGQGFIHDVCSAIHPMAASSPFLNTLSLKDHGLEWVYPEHPLAHPMEDGPAVILHKILDNMKDELQDDFAAYKKLYSRLTTRWEDLAVDLLSPFGIPNHPIRMACFGLKAIHSAEQLARRYFTGERARALFAGMAAHSILPLDKPISSAIALVLGAAAHQNGWPFPKGGSQMLSNAMESCLKSLGGEIETGIKIDSIDMLPSSKAVLFSLTPKQLLSMDGLRFPKRYRNRLQTYRYGAGVFKIDYILKEPVPWSDSRCNRAGTVHIGGTMEEIAESEKQMSNNKHPERPYVLVAQQSLFDSTRSPDHRHTLWAYCHVPSGSDRDMTRQIEDQFERFAPGFRDIVEARFTKTANRFEQYNPNYVGGDIIGGVQDLRQQFSRPVSMFKPYATPAEGVYICSSSTPPGGGVHGMCGYHCAELVLKREFNASSKQQQGL